MCVVNIDVASSMLSSYKNKGTKNLKPTENTSLIYVYIKKRRNIKIKERKEIG